MDLLINYDLLKKWKTVFATTLLFELFFQALIYLHPENLGWINSEHFSVSNLLKFLLIDQFLIECITVAIIFWLIVMYANQLRLFSIRLSLKDLIVYELKFLPLLLLSFFCFAPITLTVRYLFHFLPNLDSEVYFNEYFYSVSLYLNYLFPVLAIGYGIINVNLILLYNRQLSYTSKDLEEMNQRVQELKSRTKSYRSRLKAFDDFGELLIETKNIKWIERKDRKIFACTAKEEYRLKETITEIIEKLQPDKFIQINRSVIINLDDMLNYSFWENDKYIVRMKHDNKEFVMSRLRLKKIKDKLLQV